MSLTKDVCDQLQRETGLWQDATFPLTTQAKLLDYLEREHAELDSSIASEEAADCLMLLFHYAHKGGFSLWDKIQAVPSPSQSFLVWNLLHHMRLALNAFNEDATPENAAVYAQLLIRLCAVKRYDVEHEVRDKFSLRDSGVFFCPNGHRLNYKAHDDWVEQRDSFKERMERSEEFVKTFSGPVRRPAPAAVCWQAYVAAHPQEANELTRRALASQSVPTLFQLLREEDAHEG